MPKRDVRPHSAAAVGRDMGHHHRSIQEEEERYEHLERTGHFAEHEGGYRSPYGDGGGGGCTSQSPYPEGDSEDSLVLSSPEGSPAFHRYSQRREEELDMDPDAWMERVSASFTESR